MDDKPRRRWLCFSTRTLFLLVALLALWLASVTSEVRERAAALKELKSRGIQITTAKEWSSLAAGCITQDPIATIPLVRRWIGDEAIQSIVFYPEHKMSADEIYRLERLFPEALVTCGETVFAPFQILAPGSASSLLRS